MLTITPSERPEKYRSTAYGRQFAYGDLFRATLDAGDWDNARVFLKVYPDVIDLDAPLNTYGDKQAFYDVIMLDGELKVWPR